MYKKILVPVDGSSKSLKALDCANALAELTGGKLVVLHVIKHLQFSHSFSDEMMLENINKGREAFAQRLLEGMKKQLNPVILAKSEFILVEGQVPAEVIIDEAKERGCDAIVMSSRGLGGAESLLLGSVSHAVLNMTDMPVLIVR